MRAFIIRPFGTKEQINFNEIEEKLINPALSKLKISGRTTVEIMRSGNIREDIFNRLLTADLVIADMSLHNPNVYYELGIRHAFRDKYTVLIRSNASPMPFDLLTDRYLEYDHAHPEESVEELIKTLQQTISEEKADSPVFQYLPHLKAEDSAYFLAVPREFREAVEYARQKKLRGDLRLLALEAQGFVWEIEGLRAVGRAQFEINSLTGARKTWEMIQRNCPLDLEANLKLSTIYQRLNDYPESVEALNRIFQIGGLSREQLSEVHALRGLNLQNEWMKSWREQDEASERRKKALRSPLLGRAAEAYLKAFFSNLHNYEAGISALTLLTIEAGLAAQLETIWEQLHDDEDEANRQLKLRLKQINQLTATLNLTLTAEQQRLANENLSNFWFESAEALFFFLTSRPAEKITQAYADALIVSPPYADQTMRDSLLCFKQLELLPENVAAAEQAFTRANTSETNNTRDLRTTRKRILLFAGHQIDQKPDLVRFPANAVNEAKTKIKEAIRNEMGKSPIQIGMAGGANGGDLLFHEACREMESPIATRLFLPTQPNLFVGSYVANAGGDWIDRFWDIHNTLQQAKAVYVLSKLDDIEELPRWLQEKSGYSVRRRNNLWMINHAMSLSAEITLIVLWDGKASEGLGDIKDLVDLAKENGIKLVHISTHELTQSHQVA